MFLQQHVPVTTCMMPSPPLGLPPLPPGLRLPPRGLPVPASRASAVISGGSPITQAGKSSRAILEGKREIGRVEEACQSVSLFNTDIAVSLNENPVVPFVHRILKPPGFYLSYMAFLYKTLSSFSHLLFSMRLYLPIVLVAKQSKISIIQLFKNFTHMKCSNLF